MVLQRRRRSLRVHGRSGTALESYFKIPTLKKKIFACSRSKRHDAGVLLQIPALRKKRRG
ncbi:unnamed protein product, partial [Citrullus colocynthis]